MPDNHPRVVKIQAVYPTTKRGCTSIVHQKPFHFITFSIPLARPTACFLIFSRHTTQYFQYQAHVQLCKRVADFQNAAHRSRDDRQTGLAHQKPSRFRNVGAPLTLVGHRALVSTLITVVSAPLHTAAQNVCHDEPTLRTQHQKITSFRT